MRTSAVLHNKCISRVRQLDYAGIAAGSTRYARNAGTCPTGMCFRRFYKSCVSPSRLVKSKLPFCPRKAVLTLLMYHVRKQCPHSGSRASSDFQRRELYLCPSIFGTVASVSAVSPITRDIMNELFRMRHLNSGAHDSSQYMRIITSKSLSAGRSCKPHANMRISYQNPR